MIYGTEAEFLARMGAHTNYVERTHLSSRQMNSRLARKSLGYSKSLAMLRASVKFENAVYNWCRPVKTLRVQVAVAGVEQRAFQRRWQQRSPAMAAGLTQHIWSIREILTWVPVPKTTHKP